MRAVKLTWAISLIIVSFPFSATFYPSFTQPKFCHSPFSGPFHLNAKFCSPLSTILVKNSDTNMYIIFFQCLPTYHNIIIKLVWLRHQMAASESHTSFFRTLTNEPKSKLLASILQESMSLTFYLFYRKFDDDVFKLYHFWKFLPLTIFLMHLPN